MWWIVFTKLLIFVAAFGQPVIKTKFSCTGRPSGYYADIDSGCQVYHMCDGIGRQFSYTCPNATLFQQRMLICDHWYMVNCTRAEADYGANLLIGQQKPFVEDSHYYRTPRPDLLSATKNQSEINVIYRTGRKQTSQIVGIEAKIGDLTTENETPYVPPSHWSTINTQETGSPTDTQTPFNSQRSYNRENENSRKTGAKAFDSANKNGNRIKNDKTNSKRIPPLIRTYRPDSGSNQVNSVFESNFKATTPVYPLSVDVYSEDPSSAGVLPPEDINSVSKTAVNFESNFKATTPVYPTSVEPSSPNPNDVGLLPPEDAATKVQNISVNFESNFKATTPVYPLSVESTSLDPNTVGLVAPEEVHQNFPSNFKATTPVYPKTVDFTKGSANVLVVPPPLSTNTNTNVGFESNFTATTPVYPKSVQSTSPNPDDVGLLPPQNKNKAAQILSNQTQVASLLLDILPPKFDQNYKLVRDPNIETTISPPSKFYQAPKFDPDFTIPEVESNDQLGIRINNFMKSLSGSQWHDLREQFKIPEYDFPLEENGRPGYEGTLNSFDAKPVKKRK